MYSFDVWETFRVCLFIGGPALLLMRWYVAFWQRSRWAGELQRK
jgi:hypothetical protein